jgi:uncharacterized membrane protein YedE/YeeE
MISLHDKAWSPYVGGVLIGLLQIPAFLLVDTALGASSSFVTMGGYLASVFDPSVGDGDYFAKYMTSSKYAWQTALLVGITLGALLSARLSGTQRHGFSPIWQRAVGIKSFALRATMGFGGGFILLLGARIAGGCTSGHGISGMAQLAVSSMVAVAAMFIGGIVVANLFRRV